MRLAHKRLVRGLIRRWSGAIHVADPAWTTLQAELDRWQAAPAAFWWRDDDAVADTPALRRLLALRTRLGVPLALAAIPARAGASLAQAVGADPAVTVLMHGWDHRDHAASGRHPSEFCTGRPPREVSAQLRAGRARLARLLGRPVPPVLVPPFNRIAPELHRAVAAAGISHVSADGDFFAFPLPSRNVHADIIDWHAHTARATVEAVRPLIAALRLRRFGIVPRSEPIGIMTHHIVHDDAAWTLAEDILARISAHRMAAFPPIEQIFGYDSQPLG